LYRKWSPDINYEERLKKKKEREDEYIKNFSPDDRPLLLVNQKQNFKGVNKNDIFD